jgi:hypothetical protein
MRQPPIGTARKPHVELASPTWLCERDQLRLFIRNTAGEQWLSGLYRLRVGILQSHQPGTWVDSRIDARRKIALSRDKRPATCRDNCERPEQGLAAPRKPDVYHETRRDAEMQS